MTKGDFLAAYNIGHRDGKEDVYCPNDYDEFFNIKQQPSENEQIIRISKGTLKARTGRYVIYDGEWLKTHFNTTEAKIYGQPKTGHWFLSGGYWRCSECKEKALLKLDKATGGYREYEPIRSNYCPKCGAKMQEVQQ